MLCVLRAGEVRFRRLDSRDRTARLAHLTRLEPEARRARGLCARNLDPPEPPLAVGAFLDDCLIGTSELYPVRVGTGELALAVEPAYRRQGIGRALFERALALARNRFWRELFLFFAVDNAAVRALLRTRAARVRLEPPEACAVLALLPPTPATWALELLDLGELWRERLRGWPCAQLAQARVFAPF